MARSTLARHRMFGPAGFARTSAEGGGGGAGGGGTGGAGPGTGSGDGGGIGGGSGGGGSGPQLGPHGFPENTPLEQMSVEHREAYWKHYARQHEQTARSRADYDQQKSDAEKWRQHQQSQQTPSEQALREAEERGRREASAQANADTASALLRVSLEARGKTGDELNDLVAYANPAAFITDGKVDTAKVSAYAARIAGSPGGGGENGGGGGGGGGGQNGQNGGGGGNGFQGRRQEGQGPAKSLAAGRDLYAQRHPQKSGAGAPA